MRLAKKTHHRILALCLTGVGALGTGCAITPVRPAPHPVHPQSPLSHLRTAPTPKFLLHSPVPNSRSSAHSANPDNPLQGRGPLIATPPNHTRYWTA